MVIKKKLIRDKIHEIYKLHDTYIAEDNEYAEELKKKLQEEVNELKESDSPEDLVDILEVVYALAKHKKISKEELEKLRSDKADKRGIFDRKIILRRSVQEAN